MAQIIAQVEYVEGHLRYGHYELSLVDETLEEFKNMSIPEQKEFIQEKGEFILDDYSCYWIGPIEDIEITE